ncbi:MAG: DUF6370 family protein [Ferruginibacter sp.]
MKPVFFVLCFSFFISIALGQTTRSATALPDPNKKIRVAEISCGKCKFGLAGKTCDLAVRIDGKAYYVDGADIDSFGDAHAQDGFCNAIRKAEVQGEIVDNRFKLTYAKLLPEKKVNNKGTKN